MGDAAAEGGDGSRWRRVGAFLRRHALVLLTVGAGVLGGCSAGAVLRACTGAWTQREVMYLQFPGELFLRMLKCLIVPLLVSSVTSAIGSLDLGASRKIGARAIAFYLTTTVMAVVLGIALVCAIRPGVGGSAEGAEPASRDALTVDTLLDLVRNVFPPNLVQATIFQYRTVLTKPNNSSNIDLTEYKISGVFTEGTDVLGLVTFSVVLGIAIAKSGPPAAPLQQLFFSLSEITMLITGWVIWLSPVGVFFLVTAKILETPSFSEMVGQLGWYFLTVLVGLAIHGFLTLTLVFFILTRKSPYGYLGSMSPALVTAFGTSSSAATMPVTIGVCDKMGIDPRVSRFVIPVGATINMDGTALYEAVAAIFIAQLRNITLSFGNIIAICVTATAASIGAAGIPQAGLVTMVMVLDTVGLPAEDVSIIIAVDWLLDRFRTTINVMSDIYGTIIINFLSKVDLELIGEDTGDGGLPVKDTKASGGGPKA